MRFEKHLFISYAHIDNKPLMLDQQGWITRFHSSLEALLSMRMGDQARIWRDDKLQGNDVFADEIVDQFAQTGVLISVLTPRYLNSEWCNKEVAEFCKKAEQSGGVVVQNKARVFKVLKTPVDTQESLPAVVKDVLGYEFYIYEEETPLELDPVYGEKYAQAYNRKVGKLAWDIAQLLKKLKTDSVSGEKTVIQQTMNKTSVYLAECGQDRREDREILEGDLRRHGYKVLPEQRLPQDEEEYVNTVDSLMKHCCLSIHLVGNSYGVVPDGPSQKSVVVLQNERAVEQSKRCGLPRMIWLPDGTSSDQPLQKAFVEALHQDDAVQFGADLITGDIEYFKASIHTTLNRLADIECKLHEKMDVDQDSAKLIYLICNEKDRKATVPLRKFLRGQGFEVSIPAFKGDAAAVRKTHQQLLINCDAVIIFYGAGDESWKRTIDNELKKMPGYRGAKPLMASHTYLADPITADKEDLIEMEEPNLINGFSTFDDKEMTTFLLAMNPSGATP